MPKLYKADFKKLADIIKNARRQNTTEQACDHIAEDIADYLNNTNDRFDRNKFIEATEQ